MVVRGAGIGQVDVISDHVISLHIEEPIRFRTNIIIPTVRVQNVWVCSNDCVWEVGFIQKVKTGVNTKNQVWRPWKVSFDQFPRWFNYGWWQGQVNCFDIFHWQSHPAIPGNLVARVRANGKQFYVWSFFKRMTKVT